MADEAHPWNDAHKISCEFVFQCPRTWDRFTPTEQENIRHCSECDRDVHLVLTEEEFRRHAEGGHCVAVRVLQPEINQETMVVGNVCAPYGVHLKKV